jgi:hypothetical protein
MAKVTSRPCISIQVKLRASVASNGHSGESPARSSVRKASFVVPLPARKCAPATAAGKFLVFDGAWRGSRRFSAGSSPVNALQATHVANDPRCKPGRCSSFDGSLLPKDDSRAPRASHHRWHRQSCAGAASRTCPTAVQRHFADAIWPQQWHVNDLGVQQCLHSSAAWSTTDRKTRARRCG